MKSIVPILLILVVAFYVLPISDGFMADTETACKCIDKNADDNKDSKKDNFKEFIPAFFVVASSENCIAGVLTLPVLSAPPVHFTVETPPPDVA